MTRITTRLTAAATAALTGLVLTACTADDGGPIAAPTSATPPTPSPSPEPTEILVAPARPAAMDDDGPQGAEAAVKYFLALDSYMQATGDTTQWDAIAEADCVFCEGRRKQALEIAANNYDWDGGDVTVDIDHTYAQDAATGTWLIDITMNQASVAIGDQGGAVIQEFPPSAREVRAAVAHVSGEWLFVELADKKN